MAYKREGWLMTSLYFRDLKKIKKHCILNKVSIADFVDEAVSEKFKKLEETD